jgi:hypothetical protein
MPRRSWSQGKVRKIDKTADFFEEREKSAGDWGLTRKMERKG